MDCSARFKGSPLVDALPAGVRAGGSRLLARRISSPKLRLFCPPLDFQGVCRCNQSKNLVHHRLSLLVTLASSKSNESDYRSVGTPLELCTPEGKFLCGILKDQPHIFRAAAAKQLEELAFERDNAFARWELSEGSSESSLHGNINAFQKGTISICCYFEIRRIAEMKRRECQLAVEEVMYMLIVHSFSRINVPMVPNLSKCISNGRLDIWSSKDQELESIHGIELLEMVREHFSNILRLQGKSDSTGNWSTIKIQRLQLGRLYAASIMYGYFLKSVSLRHTLELSLSSSSEELFSDKMMCSSLQNFQKQEHENLVILGCSLDNDASLHPTAQRGKAEKLKGYMMGFDSYTLRLCAKLRSDMAGNLIENHSWALFGNLESGSLDKDEVVAVPVSGLKRLILEAVAFGTFLWDVEWFVDSKYKLKDSEDQGS